MPSLAGSRPTSVLAPDLNSFADPRDFRASAHYVAEWAPANMIQVSSSSKTPGLFPKNILGRAVGSGNFRFGSAAVTPPESHLWLLWDNSGHFQSERSLLQRHRSLGRLASQEVTSSSNQAMRPGDTLTGLGNQPSRTPRQTLVRDSEVHAALP